MVPGGDLGRGHPGDREAGQEVREAPGRPTRYRHQFASPDPYRFWSDPDPINRLDPDPTK